MPEYYTIKNLFPHLKFPEKYVGTTPIVMRSSWEIKFALSFLDAKPDVLQWSSETVVLQYYYPVDNKWHRYFTDFWMKCRLADGSTMEYVIEIKPFAQTQPPKVPKRKTRGYVDAVNTYIKNTAKWDRAKAYCAEQTKLGKPTQFVIITEKDLRV